MRSLRSSAEAEAEAERQSEVKVGEAKEVSKDWKENKSSIIERRID